MVGKDEIERRAGNLAPEHETLVLAILALADELSALRSEVASLTDEGPVVAVRVVE